MTEDFPAAHSMDSVWFAVDEEGHVALFSTGEAGAMPEDAAGEDEGNNDLYEAMGKLPKKAEEIVEARRGLDGEEGAHSSLGSGNITLLLDSPDPVRTEIDAKKARLMRAPSGCAVHFDEMDEALLERLHAQNLCRGCFFDYRNDEEEVSLAERGLFVYGHTCENWISGPYERESSPSSPLTLFEVPKQVRDKIVKLPVKFAEARHIQPAEHLDCFSWEVAWLELDGKHVHAFPDHEAEAKEMYGKGGELDDMELILVEDE
jgi:hypothetical protein